LLSSFFLQPVYCAAYWYLITACILPDCHIDPRTDKTDERKRGKTERQTDIQIERKKMREKKGEKDILEKANAFCCRLICPSPLPPVS
jgi:hypothetical protein